MRAAGLLFSWSKKGAARRFGHEPTEKAVDGFTFDHNILNMKTFIADKSSFEPIRSGVIA
jgi:hypothetical protein